MGLLGSKNKKHKFDWTSAAISFFSPAAGQLYRKNKKERAEKEDEQQLLGTIAQDMLERGYSPADVRALMLDPKSMARLVEERLKPWDTGPGGGFRYDPRTQSTIGAPRWDDDGNYYGPNRDASQRPERLIQGRKVVPIAPDGEARVFDSETGMALTNNDMRGVQGAPDPLAPPPPRPTGERPPVPVRTPQQLEALPPGTDYIGPDGKVRTKIGGAGLSAPRIFP